MNAKHTPGPLHIHRGKSGITIEHALDWNNKEHLERAPSANYVAFIPFRRNGARRGCPVTYDERPADEANAILFAAAPELLAACRRLVQTWERGERFHYGDPQSFADPIGQARAAIAKARNEVNP